LTGGTTMVILPQALQGVAIPALASLLSSTSSTGKETSSTGKETSATKGAFANILKAESDAAAKTKSAVGATTNIQEQSKTVAAAVKKAAETASAKIKDSVTTSTVGSMTPGIMLLPVNEATTAVKADSAQTKKLGNTTVAPTAQTPAAGNQVKTTGETPSPILVTSQDQANNAGLSKYRMETSTNKKGLSANNLIAGHKLPTG
jgi:hypothetical protein